MHTLLKRGLAGLAAVAAMAVVPAGPAGAEEAPVARLTFFGDGYVASGQSYAYTSTTAGTAIEVTWTGQRVHVDVSGHSEVPRTGEPGLPAEWDSFTLDLAAPPGQDLAVGTYAAAGEYPFNGAQPGIRLGGNGRGCSGGGGSFVIHELSVADGVLKRLNATFEQLCSASTTERGRLLYGVADMPALPALVRPTVTGNPGVSLAAWMPTRAVSKNRQPRYTVTVRGTFTCTVPGTFTLEGAVAQNQEFGFARGTFKVTGACTGAPAAWSAALQSTEWTPFASGPAMLGGTATVTGHLDPYYFLSPGQPSTLSQNVTVGKATLMNVASPRTAAPKPGAAPIPARPAATATVPGTATVPRLR